MLIIIADVALNPTVPSVVYEGHGTSRFTAVATPPVVISSITWTVNDQPLDMLSGITLETIVVDVHLRRLVLSNISIAYNNATVRCRAVLNTGDTVSCSPDGSLGVQGECKDRDVA